MAEHEEIPPAVEDDEETPGYKPPAPKSLNEIQNLDQEDESLRKYKDALLGQTTNSVIDEKNPLNCIVKTLSMVTDGRPDVVLDLSGDLSDLKKKTITIKEGVKYRLRIQYYIQRDIVTGLKYIQHSYRKGIKVDSTNFMVGSYGPKPDLYEYLTPVEEAPSGMLYRGKYSVKSKFTDDDKKDYLSWDWSFEIKKEWD